MGFRYRKSIKLGGGFRINVSGSGIGYSWGVPGYRITKTASGAVRTTASIPGTGISYTQQRTTGSQCPTAAVETEQPFTEIHDISTTDRTDYSDSELSALMKQVNLIPKLNTLSTIGFIVSLIFLPSSVKGFFTLGFLVMKILLHTVFSVRMNYDLDEQQRAAYEEWISAWRQIFSCKEVSSVVKVATNKSTKTNGGAAKSVMPLPVRKASRLPFCLKTNVPFFAIGLSKTESLYILPDNVLFVRNGIFASAYSADEVRYEMKMSNVIQHDSVPKDATIVAQVWEKTNADGSADKRYKGNRKLPVCAYGDLSVTSGSGLNVRFLFSDQDKSEAFKEFLPQ